MFVNLHEVYPEYRFHLLINKFTNEEFKLPMDRLIEIYGEERVIRMSNNSDPHWIIVDIN